jgi:hypothetical protein
MSLIKFLYIIRTEADFERVVCLAISGKGKFEQHFVFAGDSSLFYKDGIKNYFQKELFKQHGFKPTDFCDFTLLGRLFKIFSGGISVSMEEFFLNKKLFLPWLINAFFRRYINKNKKKIVQKVLSTIKPDFLLTDQSITYSEYIPEIFRQASINKDIPVYIFTHGAAGGLHSFFSKQNFDKYEGCTVFSCSEYEDKSDAENRIVLGDMSSSYPYVHFMNKQDITHIQFMDDRKYKVGFMVGGIGPLTSTAGWHVMEEIIIDLSANKDVAMVLKLHPRMTFYDLRLLDTFDNLLIVNRETDRSRVSKWADIVVCGDHCSTVFEPMVLGKKVVAVEGRHIPKYKNNHSPLKKSSVLHISTADKFDLENIPNADPEDAVTNTVAWGGHGKIDLAELTFEYLQKYR